VRRGCHAGGPACPCHVASSARLGCPLCPRARWPQTTAARKPTPQPAVSRPTTPSPDVDKPTMRWRRRKPPEFLPRVGKRTNLSGRMPARTCAPVVNHTLQPNAGTTNSSFNTYKPFFFSSSAPISGYNSYIPVRRFSFRLPFLYLQGTRPARVAIDLT
jgi:hypothetical protein